MAVDDTAKTRRTSFGTDGILDGPPPRATLAVWCGKNHVVARRMRRKPTRTQKQTRVGHGAYSVNAPPKSNAATKPAACAVSVTDAALFARSGLLNSKIAAVDGLTDRPTPMPIRARPANSHPTSGATANDRAPTNDAKSPINIVARR